MVVDAARHPLVLTVEDGIREGGAGTAAADAITTWSLDEGRVPPPVRVLGTPVAYIAHGKPDHILAKLGLDADGIAGEARRLVAALAEKSPG